MTTENKSKQPLLIPSIILEVLNYVPTAELKYSCRVVCKVWYEQSSRVLRKRRALKLYLTNYDTLNEYFQASQSQKEIYNEFHLGIRLQLKDPRIQRFFTQCGQFITSLDLGKSQWPNTTLRKILSENLPNLEELSMRLLTPKTISSNGELSPKLPSSSETSPATPSEPSPTISPRQSPTLTSEPSQNFPQESKPHQYIPSNPQQNNHCAQNPPYNIPYAPNAPPHFQYEESYPRYTQPFVQQEIYQPHLSSNSSIPDWSYPTPPPNPGDYSSSPSYDYRPPTFQAPEWNSSNFPSTLPPPGEYLNQNGYNYNSMNNSNQYNQPQAQPYSLSQSGPPTNGTPQGDWYYSHSSKEWYWSYTRPPPAPAPAEYNRNFSYQYQYPPPKGYHHQNYSYGSPPPEVPPPFQNVQLERSWHSSNYISYYPPHPESQTQYWNNNSNTNPPFRSDPIPNHPYKYECPNEFNCVAQPSVVKFQTFRPPLSTSKSVPSPVSSEGQNNLLKMKTLNFSIDHAVSWNQEQQEGMKIFFRDLILGMPNLEKISCLKFPCGSNEAQESNLLPLLDVICERNGQLSHLKRIDVPLKNWNKVHELGERFPLEDLKWNIQKELSFEAFQRCLWRLRRTLTKLEINFTCANSDILKKMENDFSCFQSLKKLKSLTVISYNGPVGFVLLIPALETLVLENTKPDFELMFNQKYFKNRRHSGANESLQSLTISKLCMYREDCQYGLTSRIIRKISKGFPGIRNLQLEFIGDEALRAIFINFPELDTLKISDGVFTDACFIGLSPKCFQAFRSRQTKRARLKEPVRGFQFIGSLTHLKKLDICSKYMTDISVFFGILHCKNLTSLTIKAYGLTNASLKRIASEMNLVFFKTIFCHQLTTSGAKYIKEKMPRSHLSLNEYEGPLTDEEINRLVLSEAGYQITMSKIGQQKSSK